MKKTKQNFPMLKGDVSKIMAIIRRYSPDMALPILQAMIQVDPSIALYRPVQSYLLRLVDLWI